MLPGSLSVLHLSLSEITTILQQQKVLVTWSGHLPHSKKVRFPLPVPKHEHQLHEKVNEGCMGLVTGPSMMLEGSTLAPVGRPPASVPGPIVRMVHCSGISSTATEGEEPWETCSKQSFSFRTLSTVACHDRRTRVQDTATLTPTLLQLCRKVLLQLLSFLTHPCPYPCVSLSMSALSLLLSPATPPSPVTTASESKLWCSCDAADVCVHSRAWT